MELDIFEMEGLTVIDIEGKLNFPDVCNSFKKQIIDLIDSGQNKIIMNLENLIFISSLGLSALVHVFKYASSKGGFFHLAGIDSKLYKIFKITSLTNIFTIFDTIQDGLDAFKKNA
jgi:anti-sigma B factor antagonist